LLDARGEDDFTTELRDELQYMKDRIDERGLDVELIAELLDRNFNVYLTVFRLFLTLSKDEFQSILRDRIKGGIGVKNFHRDKRSFVNVLLELGVEESIREHISRDWDWTDILDERLKAGRGSAIKGQDRGRELELEVKKRIERVFGDNYEKNCTFTGRTGEAKADFAIPNKENPEIIFEVKAYGATGSKQTDVSGDIEKIIGVKRPRTSLLLITDGITWKQRRNDLKKLVRMQNDGDISKIYTKMMLDELEKDLFILKKEYNLGL
jgi:hypothetical protein